jgi:hypothetical protein
MGVDMSEEILNEQKTRILLKLWGQKNQTAKQGELTGDLARKTKGETAPGYKLVLEQLCEAGAVVHEKKSGYSLTSTGEAELGRALCDESFKFDTNAGAKMVNALLKWIRQQQGAVSAVAISPKAAPAIDSYKVFKELALDTYERLNGSGSLVPIYRLRQEIGDQVSHQDFNKWLLEMQAEQVLYLQKGQAHGATSEQIQNSIEDEIRGLLFFISYPS